MTPQFKNYVKGLALRCGFKLKEQTDGKEDLNPYVYNFAEELLRDIDALPVYIVVLRSGRSMELLGQYKGKPDFNSLAKTERLKSYSVNTLEKLLVVDRGVSKEGVEATVHLDNYKTLELLRLVQQELKPL